MCNMGFPVLDLHLMPQEFVPTVADGTESYSKGSAAALYRKACDLKVSRGCYHLGALGGLLGVGATSKMV